MIKLAKDFELDRYGLHARLVREEDVDFILKLRTNKELTKHIHSTDDDREKQIEWLRAYKQREAEGNEYYFIFFYQGEPVGLNRMSSRSELYAVSGSWLCKPGIEPWIPIAVNFLFNDIVFEVLKIQLVVCDVRKTNKKVYKYHVMIGDVKVHESEIDHFFYRTEKTFTPKRDKLVKLFYLNSK
jgi:hypothetical protein